MPAAHADLAIVPLLGVKHSDIRETLFNNQAAGSIVANSDLLWLQSLFWVASLCKVVCKVVPDSLVIDRV